MVSICVFIDPKGEYVHYRIFSRGRVIGLCGSQFKLKYINYSLSFVFISSCILENYEVQSRKLTFVIIIYN